MMGKREGQRVVGSPGPRRSWIIRHRAGLFSALLSSSLLVVAFPPLGLSPLAWIGIAPLLYTLARRPVGAKGGFGYGLLAGSTFFYGSCFWVTYSMIHYGGLPVWLAYVLGIVPAIALGSFWGLFALVFTAIVRRLGQYGFLFAPFLWVATEWGRFQVTTIGWNALGYSQALHPGVIRLARIGGVYGVSFLLLVVQSALAWGSLRSFHLSEWKWRWTWRLIGLGGVGALVVVSMIGSSGGSRPPIPTPHERGREFRVLGIQPDIPIDALFDPELQTRHFLRLMATTRSALATHSEVDLVVWPESPLNISLDESPEVLGMLQSLVREHGVYLLLNAVERRPPDEWYNSVAVLSPEGEVIAEYEKIGLLPFGEYVPLRGLIPWIDRLPALAGDFTPGRRYTVADVGNIRVGSFICSEAAWPEIPRTLTAKGATLLIEVTNDGWFGPTAAAEQHLWHAILRAVENDRPLLRVTNNGISAYITGDGFIIDRTRLDEFAVRYWVVPRSSGRPAATFYTRFGDVLAIGCTVVGGIAALGAAGVATSLRSVIGRR
ncbi:MAG: apolipoprotein N-acyltransferase [Acidobacteria bacterium]|nr:MAG: apolipoprotein N-acyltransferase [Acidobacteriota bacterium]